MTATVVNKNEPDVVLPRRSPRLAAMRAATTGAPRTKPKKQRKTRVSSSSSSTKTNNKQTKKKDVSSRSSVPVVVNRPRVATVVIQECAAVACRRNAVRSSFRAKVLVSCVKAANLYAARASARLVRSSFRAKVLVSCMAAAKQYAARAAARRAKADLATAQFQLALVQELETVYQNKVRLETTTTVSAKKASITEKIRAKKQKIYLHEQSSRPIPRSNE